MLTAVLIDDDPDELQFFRESVERLEEPVNLITFLDPCRALEWFEKGATIPDHIFIDINMPTLEGSECLRRIRGMKAYNNSVITMISTSMSAGVATAVKELGANFTYKKPVTVNGYADMTREILCTA